MIGIGKLFNKQLTCLMVFLLMYFSLQPIKQLLHAETPNPEPLQQGSNVSFNRQTFHAGDAVQISVYPDTTSFINGIFPINGEGFVTLPLKGSVKITEMSLVEFEQYLNESFRQYIRTPDVRVRSLIRASLLGGFNVPGLYYIDKNLTLWQLIQKAHGTIQDDGLKKMKWERNKKTLSDNLVSYFESGKSLQEIGFKSGDQISVPVPGGPGFIDRAVQILPFVSVAIAGYTMYLTYFLAYSR